MLPLPLSELGKRKLIPMTLETKTSKFFNQMCMEHVLEVTKDFLLNVPRTFLSCTINVGF